MDERCIAGLESLPEAVRGCVLTIGNFDGVHLGHRRIVELARTLAGRAAVVAMTFEPPPDLVLRPEDPPRRVVPPAIKCRLLLEAGCDCLVTAKADRALLGLEPAEFIRQVIVGRFAPRHMVEGPNFFFGRRRAGDIDTLRSAGAAAGFEVHVAEPVRLDLGDGAGPQVVSSTLVRDLVAGGRVADAARCLGRAYALHGRVVAGAGVGRTLGFPTANIAAGDQVCPGDGVYAGWADFGDRRYVAAVSVGTRPTFGEMGTGTPKGSQSPFPRTIEAFLLDAAGDFYGRDMALGLVSRLRDQHRFDSPEALAAQMAKDVEEVRRVVE